MRLGNMILDMVSCNEFFAKIWCPSSRHSPMFAVCHVCFCSASQWSHRFTGQTWASICNPLSAFCHNVGWMELRYLWINVTYCDSLSVSISYIYICEIYYIYYIYTHISAFVCRCWCSIGMPVVPKTQSRPRWTWVNDKLVQRSCCPKSVLQLLHLYKFCS